MSNEHAYCIMGSGRATLVPLSLGRPRAKPEDVVAMLEKAHNDQLLQMEQQKALGGEKGEGGDCVGCPGKADVIPATPEEFERKKRSTLDWLKKMASGAAGIMKSELGIDAAPVELVNARRATCEPCDFWEHGMCTKCECFTWAKTRVLSQECPESLWPTVNGCQVDK